MRFGLFGTGPWAHQAHAPALAAHPGVEFVGVWGRNADKAAELAQQYGVVPYTDAGALIADVEAIAVALPPDVQAPLALRAARAGRHLLLDKPVALTVAEAVDIAAAAAEHRAASVVFFTRRLMPELDGFLKDAAITGGWTEGRVAHVGSIFAPGNPFGASPWRRQNGGLWDVGPHALALVTAVLGPVSEVTGMSGRRDMTQLLLRHVGGAISALTLSVDAPAKAEREEAAFAGEDGVLLVPDLPWDPVGALSRGIGQLLTAAAGGPASALDCRFGADVTAVLVAAQQAIASGRAVTIGSTY